MFTGLFKNVSEEDKNAAIADIIQHATPRHDFFLMLTLAVAMAAFGIILGSTVILVGSMLIAPLLYPFLSLSLGIIVSDEKLIGRSFYTIGKSVVFALAASAVIGFLFSSHTVSTLALPLGGTGLPSSLMYILVAAIAGFAAAFAMTKPYLNETLPGVAIAVALVPPLSAAGIALSLFDWADFSNALLLFVVNGIGIVFSAMIVFALFRFSVKKTVTKEAVKEGDKIIKQEATPVKPAKPTP
ncbi:MAG: DUF389 domain-containing protein [Patescibacteria group bacterium]|nr:DUF389 domain-containing protein [Patescibacteria group bacterium]